MASKSKPERISKRPKLSFFSIPPPLSPEHSGTLTPPLYTTVSVPFRWEEQPGKPRSSTAVTTFTSNTLELPPPPRLLMETQNPKLPSPTTVLEGPYVGRAHFSPAAKRRRFGALDFGKRVYREKWRFGFWRRKLRFRSKREGAGGHGYVALSSMDGESDAGGNGGEEESGSSTARIRSFLSFSAARSHLWESICKGVKQWK